MKMDNYFNDEFWKCKECEVIFSTYISEETEVNFCPVCGCSHIIECDEEGNEE